MSDTVTEGIRVRVSPAYHRDQSAPERGRWFFSYTIQISNESETTAKLLSRTWRITDGNGAVEEVRGPGVVGRQPRLEPGQAFEYTSFCPLPTPIGSMEARTPSSATTARCSTSSSACSSSRTRSR
jgi:ApaG protein